VNGRPDGGGEGERQESRRANECGKSSFGAFWRSLEEIHSHVEITAQPSWRKIALAPPRLALPRLAVYGNERAPFVNSSGEKVRRETETRGPFRVRNLPHRLPDEEHSPASPFAKSVPLSLLLRLSSCNYPLFCLLSRLLTSAQQKKKTEVACEGFLSIKQTSPSPGLPHSCQRGNCGPDRNEFCVQREKREVRPLQDWEETNAESTSNWGRNPCFNPTIDVGHAPPIK